MATQLLYTIFGDRGPEEDEKNDRLVSDTVAHLRTIASVARHEQRQLSRR